MSLVAWTSKNPLVKSFFKSLLGINLVSLNQVSDSSEFSFLVVDDYEVAIKLKASVVFDCFIGKLNSDFKLANKPERVFGFSKLPHITDHISLLDWDFLEGLTPEKTVSCKVAVLVGDWAIDQQFFSRVKDVAQDEMLVLNVGHSGSLREMGVVEVATIQELIEGIKKAEVVINPAEEIRFPILEVIASRLGKIVVSSKNGSVYDHLKNECVYFSPYDLSSYDSALKASRLTGFKCVSVGAGLGGSLQKIFNIMMEQDFDKALEDIEKAAAAGDIQVAKHKALQLYESDKLNPKLLRVLGVLEYMQGNLAAARGWLSQSYLLDDSDSKTMCGLGMVLHEEGLSDKALAMLEKSYFKSAQPWIPMFKIVQISYQIEEYSTAIRVLEDFIAKNGDSLEAKFSLAGIYFKNADFEKAKRLVEDILRENPSYPAAADFLEMINQRLPEFQQTENPGEQAEVVLEVSTDFQSSETNNLDLLEAELRHAERLKREGKFQEALDLLINLYSEDLPEHSRKRVQFLVLETKLLLGDHSFVEQNFDFFETNYAQDSRWLCLKGTLQLMEANFEKARDYFEQALLQEENNDMAFAGLGLVCELEGKTEEALKYYKRALKANPLNLRATLGFAEVARSLNLDQEAITALEQFNAQEKNVDVQSLLLDFYMRLGDWTKSEQMAKEILLSDPRNTKAAEVIASLNKQSQINL
mgnify:CR=1 FL=1